MNEQNIKVCWFCQSIYTFERKTSRYCSDTCRVKDNNICNKEIEDAIFALKMKQETERKIKSGRIFIDYMEKMDNKQVY